MIRFIWNSWWRNKERFILLIVGALIVSTGLSYLVGITQANKGTIVDELQKRWKASYHIVVRPPESRAITEEKNLLEPNYLSGLSGGISLEQYEKIKSMEEIDVAAPIAMLGYVNNTITLKKLNLSEPGVYRLRLTEKTNTGLAKEKEQGAFYFTVGSWKPTGTGKEYGVTQFSGELSYGTEILLAGIDPEAESKLIGLDQAMIQTRTSRFFNEGDQVVQMENDVGSIETTIPVIVSNREFVDSQMTFTIEKLDLPFQGAQQAATMEKVKENGGEKYLEKQKGITKERYTFTSKEAHRKIVESILHADNNGETVLDESVWMALKPSPVHYEPVTSPFPERWPFAYQVKPYTIPEHSNLPMKQAYRPVTMFSEEASGWPRLRLDFKGVFDPQKLNISKDPLTELPMETYFPSKAKWVLDSNEKPVNPTVEMKPLNNPYGFLTKPPLMLTTLEAAKAILGEKPIAAIRIKVKGVDKLTNESESILRDVAKRIEQSTGLITDITLGSSPQPALTHIPGIEGKASLGWIEQPWIKLGSSVSIFKEAKIGLSGVIASVILVAIVYVFSSNLMMMYARRKEFAVLLSLGWRPYQLSKLLFIEATVIGLFVSAVSWLILGFIYVTNDIQTSGWRVLLIGVFGLIIYWFGALIPAVLVRNIQPYEAMRSGEVSARTHRFLQTQSLIMMSLNYLYVKWKRSVLSILAIALPTSLFIFFLFVTFRLKGVMYATWLGQYVAMEVSTMHYVAMGIALLIAMLTTAEVIWQNISERQPEIAVLKAVGWQNKHVRLLVLLEGAFSGFIAGLLGLGFATLLVWRIYGEIPFEHLPFLMGTVLIPILTGVIGAILPAEKAVKILPYQGIQGTFENTQKTEKRFKYVFSVAGAALFIGILSLLASAIPDIKYSNSSSEKREKIERTEGKLIETFTAKKQSAEESPKQIDDNKENHSNSIQSYIDSAYKTLKLGESHDIENGENVLTFGHKVTPPIHISKANEEMELITIPVTFELKSEFTSFVFKPYGYVIIDEQGNEYEVKDIKIIENENWKDKVHIQSPGKAKVLLTFEVPVHAEKLIMLVKHEWLPGDVVVKVK
jgi:ABC-type lipoprotein release transport system permease subunit